MTVYVSKELCEQKHGDTERQFAEIKEKLASIEGKLDILIDVKAKSESCQKELTEHKEDHWKFAGTVIGVCGIMVGVGTIAVMIWK